MKSLIIYGSQTKLTNVHKLVTGPKQPKYFVRVNQFNGDMTQALEKAKPMTGETVLNTVEVET